MITVSFYGLDRTHRLKKAIAKSILSENSNVPEANLTAFDNPSLTSKQERKRQPLTRWDEL